MLTRRTILKTGTASVVVLGAGCAATMGSKDIAIVREPWVAASKGFGDARLNSIAYAILAPNPHNRQPWLIELGDDVDTLTLYCDRQRLLPHTDPQNRQITIGLGAFLELFRQAAAQQGYIAQITPFPDGEPHPHLDERKIAQIRLQASPIAKPDPLFGHALARRTVRKKFDTSRPLAPADFSRLATEAKLSKENTFATTLDAEKIERLKTLCRDGWVVETSTPDTHHESTALTRIGATEVAANPDGISLFGPSMELYKSLGVLTRAKMNETGSRAQKGALSFYNGLIDTAVAFGWLSTPRNSRGDQLRAGADWVRLNLAATKLGMAMHPLSQVLQEFPEMAELYTEFHAEVGMSEPARVQGLFRFGYAKYPKAAPRWPLESRLVNMEK